MAGSNPAGGVVEALGDLDCQRIGQPGSRVAGRSGSMVKVPQQGLGNAGEFERHLGWLLVVGHRPMIGARAYARVHWQNLVNVGILRLRRWFVPLTRWP
jgi:hypothetical protein